MKRNDMSAVWSLTGCFALFLLSMSVLWVHRPVQAMPTMPVTKAAAESKNLPMEHWTDPKVSHEERLQIAGIVVFFAAIGWAGNRRRAKLRRFYRA
jgi:hypothetical protein